MSRNGFTDIERAQFILQITEGCGKVGKQRLFMEKYEKSPPARSTTREWYQAYQSRASHAHKGRNGRPRIRSTVRSEILKLIENDLRISLREEASEKGVAHGAV